ncbi:hypothetical protein CPAR01_05101 [Colletotrichum paranaense]|uniref:Uncharacterized protein n=1 Tax=Colletotrichum paranaense TaxID=1914294 RepID=A0ABQ9SQB0_9PEZI|nr:uncharacterized protein CPAR01_05101 [Colletotrichum paranaense]KAK1541714.1 hypothetical protein CPAR01_05101 [Colletotrichum paranaense]
MSGNEATNISYTGNVAVIAQIVKCDRASAHLSPTSAYAAQLSWLTIPGHVRHDVVNHQVIVAFTLYRVFSQENCIRRLHYQSLGPRQSLQVKRKIVGYDSAGPHPRQIMHRFDAGELDSFGPPTVPSQQTAKTKSHTIRLVMLDNLDVPGHTLIKNFFRDLGLTGPRSCTQ